MMHGRVGDFMKRNCIKKHIMGLLACILVAGNIAVMPAEAGSSNLIVDSSSFNHDVYRLTDAGNITSLDGIEISGKVNFASNTGSYFRVE